MQKLSPIRLLIVDDHPVVREGLASMLQREPDIEIVGRAENGTEAISMFRSIKPDIALVDLSLPDLSGVEVITHVRTQLPDARFIVLSVHRKEDEVYRAISAGARAYLQKDVAVGELLNAIRTVHAGSRYLSTAIADSLADHFSGTTLTPRETDVLRRLVSGKTNKELAQELKLSEKTVKAHLSSILDKLGVCNRSQAIMVAVRRGLVADRDL